MRGQKGTRGKRNQLGCPCNQFLRALSLISLFFHIFALDIFSTQNALFFFSIPLWFLLFTLHCLKPSHPAIPIVSPSHLFSTLLVSLLGASHKDHMPAGLQRLSQWSMTHKDIHKAPSPPPSYFLLSMRLTPTFPIHS